MSPLAIVAVTGMALLVGSVVLLVYCAVTIAHDDPPVVEQKRAAWTPPKASGLQRDRQYIGKDMVTAKQRRAVRMN